MQSVTSHLTSSLIFFLGRLGWTNTLLMIMCECGASCVFKQCLAEGERSYFLLLIFFFPFLSFLSFYQAPPNLRSLFVKVLFYLALFLSEIQTARQVRQAAGSIAAQV